MIFVNFKTFPQASGERALQLAEICEKIGKKTKVKIIPVVQAVDLYRIAQTIKIPIWVQHLDWQKPGPFTGWLNLENIINNQAQGAILNHTEHKIPAGKIRPTVKRAKDKKFQTLICCRSLGQAGKLMKAKPDFMAYEPSELIGGKISVSQAEPKMIKHFVEEIKPIPAIIGAGIKTKEDVQLGLEQGAKGILVASGIVLAKDQEKALQELAQGFH